MSYCRTDIEITSPFYFLRQGLLLNLELPVSSGLLREPQGSSSLHASSQHWELQTPPTTLGFYLSAEAADSGPHACIAGTLAYALDQLCSPAPSVLIEP